MSEVALWDPPPVLVDLEEMMVTQRGEVLWPPPARRRQHREDGRSRPPGASFPVGWFGQELGKFRAGNSTYNCYAPDELPPIRIPLTGSFDWLEAAPEQDLHLAASPETTAAALRKLLVSHAMDLPPEFVKFFQTPSLWRRISTCTDCYLCLDSAAIGIRGSLGSLVTFMADSQGCKHWHLHISPCGTRHTVVATYFNTGSENVDRKGGLPHPKDITTVAGSFEEFIYRFWLENAMWFALHDKGKMPECGEEYLAYFGRGA